MRLVGKGVRFREIAGNGDILITSVVPAEWRYDLLAGKVLFEKPILTGPLAKRIAINVPVKSLDQVLSQLTAKKFLIEHIYDY
ncbi:hypothetical protein ACFQAT_01070 [Undibacterium arcticum]